MGDRLGTRITVANGGRRASSPTRLCLHTPGLADVVVSVGRLDPGGRTSVVVERPATRRTASEGTTGHLVCRPALGLVAATRTVEIADPVIVHPVLREQPVPSTATVVRDREDGRAVVAGGEEVLGVREWRPGDDPGRVHWRSTARSGRLTLLERGDVESVADSASCSSGPTAGPASRRRSAWRPRSATRPSRTAPGSPRWRGTSTDPSWRRRGRAGTCSTGGRACATPSLPDPARFGGLVAAGFGPGDLLVAGPPDADAAWLVGGGRSLHRPPAVPGGGRPVTAPRGEARRPARDRCAPRRRSSPVPSP